MPRTTVPRFALAAGLVYAMVVTPASGGARQPDGEVATPSAVACPNPVTFCEAAHPGSTVTQFCSGEACFEMNYGDEMRIVAADELGDYPRRWFIWQGGGTLRPAGLAPCVLSRSGGKTRVDIGGASVRCRVDLETDNHLYHEHIVSNPATACLGWVECRAF